MLNEQIKPQQQEVKQQQPVDQGQAPHDAAIIVKYERDGVLHRRRATKDDVASVDALFCLIDASRDRDVVKWLDDDNEYCVVSSDAELADAVLVSGDKLRLTVEARTRDVVVAPTSPFVTPPPLAAFAAPLGGGPPRFFKHHGRFAPAHAQGHGRAFGRGGGGCAEQHQAPIEFDDVDSAVAITMAALERTGFADDVRVVPDVGAPLRVARQASDVPVLGGFFVQKCFEMNKAGGAAKVDEFVAQRLSWLQRRRERDALKAGKHAEKAEMKAEKQVEKAEKKLEKFAAKRTNIDDRLQQIDARLAELERAGPAYRGPPRHVLMKRREQWVAKQAKVETKFDRTLAIM